MCQGYLTEKSSIERFAAIETGKVADFRERSDKVSAEGGSCEIANK
ncbi:MAG: hypothetical protein ACRC62_22710 [Microcoleus sp.]